jgi:hypothetical protein
VAVAFTIGMQGGRLREMVIRFISGKEIIEDKLLTKQQLLDNVLSGNLTMYSSEDDLPDKGFPKYILGILSQMFFMSSFHFDDIKKRKLIQSLSGKVENIANNLQSFLPWPVLKKELSPIHIHLKALSSQDTALNKEIADFNKTSTERWFWDHAISIIKKSRFDETDIKKLSQRDADLGPGHFNGEPKSEDISAFLANTRISLTDDGSILIIPPGNFPNLLTAHKLKSRDEKTDEWEMLCNFISDPKLSLKVQSSSNEYKVMKAVAKKLINFFNGTYSVIIPNWKYLFSQTQKGTGMYKLNFKKGGIKKALSKDRALQQFELLLIKYEDTLAVNISDKAKDELKEEIHDLVEVILNNKYLSYNEVQERYNSVVN